MRSIRIGIIGSGFIARTHAVSIKRYLKGAVLAGIAGGKRATSLAAEFEVTNFPSVEQMAADKDVDAVIITSPHSFHFTHAMICAEAGKHALVEKPMARTLAECETMERAFAARYLVLMVAFTQRYRETNRRAFELIHAGAIGRISMIQEFALQPNALEAYPKWQQLPENLGVFFGYGIHNIDRLRWFLDAEAENVTAEITKTPSGIEISTMAIIRWQNSTISSVWSSGDLKTPGFPATAFRSLVVGEKGMLDVDGYGALRLSVDSKPWETLFQQPPIDWRGEGMFAEARMGSFNAQNQEFVQSILEGRKPAITAEDGRKAVAIALAIYKSAEEHEVIQLK